VADQHDAAAVVLVGQVVVPGVDHVVVADGLRGGGPPGRAWCVMKARSAARVNCRYIGA